MYRTVVNRRQGGGKKSDREVNMTTGDRDYGLLVTDVSREEIWMKEEY